MSDIDQVRLLIPDNDPGNQAFSDDQIQTFLSLSGNRVFLAAARALEVIATDEALIYKIVRTDDLSVNGVTGADFLLNRAKQLRADQDKADAEEGNAFFLTFPDPLFGRTPEAMPTPWFC